MTKVLGVLLFAVMLAAISAAFGGVTMLLWNAVAVGVHHGDAQVSFGTAWAGYVLLSIVASMFRSAVK